MDGNWALRESEQRFRQLFHDNPNPMWVYDRQTLRILDVNEAAVAMYGYSRAEFQQLRLFDLRPPEDVPQLMAKLGTLKPGYSDTGAWRHVTKDRRIIEVETGTFMSKSPDGGLTCLVVIHDISARKRAERALLQAQKMEAVGQLTGGMAHDFNNLLSVIIGNLDMLSERDSDPEGARLMEGALSAALKGAELSQRLLAFARQQPLEPKALALNTLLPGIADLLSRSLGERIALQLLPAPDVWPAMADASQVENAVLNLAINARDAMPNGGRLVIEAANVQLDEVYAAANPDAHPGDYVMLCVSDTGTGMPPEVVERAFDPFFTTKPTGKGSGLGLSMVYGFARQSGGHLKIYSEVGHGTSVKLYLPRARENTHPAANLAAINGTEAGPVLGETILVAEDQIDVRRTSVAQLESLGYRVLQAEDAQGALEILEREPVDLLFTDVVMPGPLTGVALIEEARRRQPALKVLLTTGYTEAALADAELPAEVGVLSKPYRRQELASRIRQSLDAGR
jgi:PAS domain S-box-containing protein